MGLHQRGGSHGWGTTWVIMVKQERKDSENGREKRLES